MIACLLLLKTQTSYQLVLYGKFSKKHHGASNERIQYPPCGKRHQRTDGPE